MKQFSAQSPWREAAPRAIATLGLFTTLLGFAAWAVWLATGDWTPITSYFRYPAPLVTIVVCVAEVALCFEAWQSCDDREPLRATWMWLFIASLAHLGGRVLALPGSTSVAATQSATMNDVGRVLGGPFQMSLLLAGLVHLLVSLRRLGLLRRLARTDYVLLLIVGGLLIRTLYGISVYIDGDKPVTFLVAALWTSDPLLTALLAAAVLIRRAVAPLGRGLLANCWRSFVVAIVIISIASATSWCIECSNYEVWTSFSWFLWLPADMAFALAPAFQVAALQHARNRARVFEAFGVPAFWRVR